MKGILKNTPAGWYVWYIVMRDEITSGYDSIPLYQETFDFNGKQPIIPLVEGKQVEFNIEDFWETGGDEGIKLAKLILPKEEPKQETLEEFIKKSYLSRLQDCLSVDFADGIKLGVKWGEEQDKWKLVFEETPPSNIELLVKSPTGVIHLSSWRESYNIFSCQAKTESSLDWKWKTI